MAKVRAEGATGWAGVPLTDRRSERHDRLVAAAFELFGTEGEAGVTVRAVSRVSRLHARYFYESFPDTGALLGAVYDRVTGELAGELETALATAGDDVTTRLREGIRAVLAFASADPRRGRILFSAARTHPVLAARRRTTQAELMEMTMLEAGPADDPVTARIGAAMFTGAMVELVHQWLDGALGDDLNAVVERATSVLLTQGPPGGTGTLSTGVRSSTDAPPR